jgi:hypothetical protein
MGFKKSDLWLNIHTHCIEIFWWFAIRVFLIQRQITCNCQVLSYGTVEIWTRGFGTFLGRANLHFFREDRPKWFGVQIFKFEL